MTDVQRIHGCLAGLAIGDALGMPTEFLTPDEIAREMGWVDRFVAAPRWHPHAGLKPGQVTDDTGQTLSVIRAAAPEGWLTADSVARELLAWADNAGESLACILGPSTGQALDALRQGANPRDSGRQGKSNGAAYRGVVPGLLYLPSSDRLMEEVVEVCLPTHGTSVAISGAAAAAYAVAAALQDGATVDGVLESARQGAAAGRAYGAWTWGTPLDQRIDLAVKIVRGCRSDRSALSELYGSVGVDILVAESVGAAFGLVALADGDPMKAVVYGANIGGDTDTIAAIAGAVCGALRGISAIDPILLAEVERVNGLDLAAEANTAAALRAKVGHE